MNPSNFPYNQHGFCALPNHEDISDAPSHDDISLPPKTVNATAHSQAVPAEYKHTISPSTPPPTYHPSHHFWKKPSPLAILAFIGDLFLTILPCLFIVLAFQALSVDGTPISSHGKTIERAAQLSPTLFPVIFAAAVGRLMRTYALSKAEKGASLGILEQLNGSQNLLAAIERAFMLRSLSVLGIGAVLLWMLSPLGGQSSLRVLGRRNVMKPSETNLFYFNTAGNYVCCSAFSDEDVSGEAWTTLTSILLGALVSIERTKGRDIWGNIKIPFLEYTPAYERSESRDGWYDFSESDYNATYSALTGTVINGLRDGADAQFVMESSYFNMSCNGPKFFKSNYNHSGSMFYREMYQNGSLYYSGLLEWANTSASSFPSPAKGDFSAYLLAMRFNESSPTTYNEGFHVLYCARVAQNEKVAAYDCKMDRITVESGIFCRGTECQVRQIRLSPTIPPKVGTWPLPDFNPYIPKSMIQLLATLTPSKWPMTSPVDMFIRGSNTPFRTALLYDHNDDTDYHNISGRHVAERLASLINTVWQIGMQGAATAQAPSNNLTALKISTDNMTMSSSGVGYSTMETLARLTTYEEQHVANKPWVTVTFVISIILLLCAIANLSLKYMCAMPDILGYVSSMTREHPDFEHIPGGDKMDGLERARVLKHYHVTLAEDDDGTIRLRSLGRMKE
jgi:hypothetical protein